MASQFADIGSKRGVDTRWNVWCLQVPHYCINVTCISEICLLHVNKLTVIPKIYSTKSIGLGKRLPFYYKS